MMILIADVFPKLRAPKDVVRQMTKKSRFRGPFDKQLGKRAHWTTAPLPYLLITVKALELEKVSLIDM